MKGKQSNAAKICRSAHIYLYVIAGSFIGGISTQLVAQDESALPWYQIEVVIFENRAYNSYGPDPEAWPRDIFLGYPTHSQYLLTPEELKALEAKERDENINPEEKSFIDLGENFFQLKRVKNAIYGERDLRVLYHKVWRQPVSDRDDTPAVVVIAGNQYDDHHELEGSLKISVSRYLHLDANLWFTSFEANIGQEDIWWPQLPTLPRRNQEDSLDEIVKGGETQLKTTPPPWMSGEKGNSNIRFGTNSSYLENEGNEQHPLQNYVTREIIKFEQTRRMRSGELHYLDHPKLGLIIRVDNYKKPEDLDAQKDATE